MEADHLIEGRVDMHSSSVTETPSPFHEGELALQRGVGALELMDDLGRRYVRNYLTEQQSTFYPQLPFVLLGAVAPDGDVWPTLRAGAPGFLSSPDPTHLHVAAARDANDPADAGMENGDNIALLGIELPTRRRNRMNGTIGRTGPDGFTIAVRQAYGNCPQYIQSRDFTFVSRPDTAKVMRPVVFTGFDEATKALVQKADTFFVASYVETPDHGRSIDVSHRGGRPGFVRLDEDGTLTIPDFAGNKMFNTMGNFTINPKAGLLFVDFDTGSLLQMTGDAEIVFHGPEIAQFEGAERVWRFHPRRILYRPEVLPLRWSFAAEGWSPHTLMTGTWTADVSPTAEIADTNPWRPYRVVKIVEESTVVRSLTLQPVDGGDFVPHLAGQHLPVRALVSGQPEKLQRNYTLSVAPSHQRYRISVKREGVFSNHLHTLREGDVIEARRPAGAFTIDPFEQRPAVLLSGGIGVTPMLAMLHHIVHEGVQAGRIRPTWFFHAARTVAERAFDQELSELVDQAQGAVRRIRVLDDISTAKRDEYDRAGRIDMAALQYVLPFNDYDFYLCGPAGFMQSLYDGLRALNIADERIHAEAFGPAGLRREIKRPGPGHAACHGEIHQIGAGSCLDPRLGLAARPCRGMRPAARIRVPER